MSTPKEQAVCKTKIHSTYLLRNGAFIERQPRSRTVAEFTHIQDKMKSV